MTDIVMITVTQERVYKLYQRHYKISTVAQRIGKSQDIARTIILQLVDMGLMQKPTNYHGGYKIINKPYVVIPDKEAPKKPMQFDITISQQEKAWMRANYPKMRRHRDQVAKILGRSRLDVNFMAITLGLAKKEG